MLIKYCENYVIFDIETTGFSPETDAVVELSALKVRGGEIVDEFSALINPEMHIPYTVNSINGITDDLVKDAPTMETVIMQIPLKQHADSDRTACCSASNGTE